jgi:hypothetical protein
MTITRVTMAAIPQRDAIARPHQYPDVNSEWKNPVALSFMPVIPMSFVKDDQLLNYFSMVTTVGTPQTVAAQELRIECMFPADETTETRHNELIMASLSSSQFDAVDGSSTGTSVPWMWALLRLPRFRGASHADDNDNRVRYRQVGFPGSRR